LNKKLSKELSFRNDRSSKLSFHEIQDFTKKKQIFNFRKFLSKIFFVKGCPINLDIGGATGGAQLIIIHCFFSLRFSLTKVFLFFYQQKERAQMDSQRAEKLLIRCTDWHFQMMSHFVRNFSEEKKIPWNERKFRLWNPCNQKWLFVFFYFHYLYTVEYASQNAWIIHIKAFLRQIPVWITWKIPCQSTLTQIKFGQ